MTGLAEDKLAFLTGAGSGIGRAAAQLFATEGARMVITTDIDRSAAEETARLIVDAGGVAEAAELDVADRSAVHATVAQVLEAHSSIECAVNCAGVRGPMGLISAYDADAWRQVMEVNLDGVFFCMQAEIEAMLMSGGGAIVNIASGAVLEPHATLSAYGASKAGVEHLTRTAAVEYAGAGIRVNGVLPGRTRTAMLDDYYRLTPGAEERALADAPMGRLGSPSETAEVIVWLCSDRASYVAGTTMLVDGAFHAGRPSSG